MATRMVGGFILVAFLLCVLLAWPGRRRWPLWLIAGLCGSICAALTLSLTAAGGGLVDSMRLTTVALATRLLWNPRRPVRPRPAVADSAAHFEFEKVDSFPSHRLHPAGRCESMPGIEPLGPGV